MDFSNVKTEGIANVSKDDIVFAEKLGYRIKLLGIARMTETDLEQCVHPAMVLPLEDLIAHVEDVFNAVVVDGDYVDTLMFEGRGAGEKPTASAVVGDESISPADLTRLPFCSRGQTESPAPAAKRISFPPFMSA